MNLSYFNYSARVGLIVSAMMAGACSGPPATTLGKCFTDKPNCPADGLSTAASQQQCKDAGGKSWLGPGGTCVTPP
jgi:hypothetical protein